MSRDIIITGFEPIGRKQSPVWKASERNRLEVWTFNSDHQLIPFSQRHYEMHELSAYENPVDDSRPDEKYLKALKDGLGVPVYTLRKTPQIVDAVAYPREAMTKVFGSYFTNSISYMLANAIAERVDSIQVWGIDMARDHENGWERPSIEYFLGWARGSGIKVVIPDTSDLLKCIGFYGYGENNPYENEAKLRDRLASVRQQERRHRSDAATMAGAGYDIEYWLRRGHILGDPKTNKKIIARKKWLLGMSKKYSEYGDQYEKFERQMKHP